MTPDNLLNNASELACSISQAAKQHQSISSLLDEIKDCAFIGNKDGELISANSTFDRVFGNGVATTGRDPRTFLHPETLSLWDAAHQMLQAGCAYILAEHSLNHVIAEEFSLRCCTAIYLIQDVSCPGIGSVGLSRVLGRIPRLRNATIESNWKNFQKLSTRSQECALHMVRGKSLREIAAELHISSRTLDSECKSILNVMAVSNSHELGRMMCRFQDTGFADFGF